MAEPSSSAPATSVATACRAVVMLLCLVALPLAALRGASWSNLTKTVPEIAKKIIPGRWGSNPALAKDGLPEAPLFRSPDRGEPRSPQQGPTSSIHCESHGDPWPQRDPAPEPPAEPRRSVRAAIPEDPFADRRFPDETPRPDDLRLRAAFQARENETAEIHRAALVPVARRDRAWSNAPGADSPPLQDAVIRPGAKPRRMEEPADRLTYVLDRLRELGAVYYLLETWGNDAQRFRFHCKMAIAGNPDYTRHFEAIDREAIQAMGKVLAEAEAWRADR